ncbi:MAG: carboxypeptidase regulatory-like domain-containing protein [Kofleriaceae bacterium]
MDPRPSRRATPVPEVPRARRGPLAYAAAVALAAWFASLASAAPIVEVRSKAELKLDAVTLRGPEEIEVSGHLFDPTTSLGLERQEVLVQVGDQRAEVVTEADGKFRVVLPARPGPQSVQLSYRGNISMDDARLEERADPSRRAVTLSFSARPMNGGVELTVTAVSDAAEFLPPLTLWADSARDPELRKVADMTAGAPVRLTRKQLGGAGTRQFRAEYAGDGSHQPATVLGTYELTSASRTTLEAAKRVPFEDKLVAKGTVVDEDATPLPGVAVELMAGDRRLAQGVTDDRGAYRFSIEGEILGVGQHTLQTVSETARSVQSSRSPPATVTVAPPQPVPVTYTVITFLATGLAAGAFFAGRSKPWRRLAKPAPPSQQVAANAEAQEGGLVIARPSLVSTLRRASDLGFSGVVRDTVRGRAVPGATIVVRRSAATAADEPARSPYAPPPPAAKLERRAESDGDGAFALEELAGGEWRVSVSAPSHITESFTISLPHRGEFRGVRVDLVPVREKVFLLYQRAAQPLLPDPKLWGVWSPRQVVDHVRGNRPSAALADLTDFVEEVYFSSRPLLETVLPVARQRVEAAIAERES